MPTRSQATARLVEAEDAPVVKVVASAVQIVVGLTDNRQISFTTGFEGDEADEVINARFDRVMYFADRLKAKYEVRELEKDIAHRREVIENLEEDRARLDAQYEHDHASLLATLSELHRRCEQDIKDAEATVNAEILAMQERKEQIVENGRDWARKHGRMEGYKPQGNDAVNLKRIDEGIKSAEETRNRMVEAVQKDADKAIERLQADITKAENERAQWVGNNDFTFKRHREGLAAAEEALAEAKITAGG